MKFILVILYLISFIFTDQNVKKCGMFIDSQNRDWDEYRPSLAESFLSSDGYFMIHFDRSGIDAVSSSDSDGDGIPNYIEEVESAAMYSKNLLLDMGYLSPISDVDCSYTDVDIDGVSVNDTCIDAGGFDCVFNAGDATDGTEEACDNNDDNGIYDIYILDMDAGYYGVNWPEEYILNASFVVIDNEYESADYGEVSGLDAMKVTVAHEFFHAVQRSYIDYQPISNQYDHMQLCNMSQLTMNQKRLISVQR